MEDVFCFSNDFFELEVTSNPKDTSDKSYEPFQIHPEWFYKTTRSFDEDYLKCRGDHLYHMKRYSEALECYESLLEKLSKKGARREFYEAAMICASRCHKNDIARRHLDYLRSLKVEDAGLEYACLQVEGRLAQSSNFIKQ